VTLKVSLRMGAVAPALIVVTAAVAGASGGEAHAAGAPTAGQWLLLLFTCINFAAFVYLFRRFTSEPLRDFLKGRRKEIVDLMAEAAREKAEAAALKREYEAKLAGLERAKQELVDEVRRMAESDAQKLLSAASEAAARLKRDAERAAQSDHDRVVRELRAEAARLAASLATEDVVRRLDAGARQRLLDEFLQGVAKA
jgi:F-type H+-transporting ATPase subunit b